MSLSCKSLSSVAKREQHQGIYALICFNLVSNIQIPFSQFYCLHVSPGSMFVPSMERQAKINPSSSTTCGNFDAVHYSQTYCQADHGESSPKSRIYAHPAMVSRDSREEALRPYFSTIEARANSKVVLVPHRTSRHARLHAYRFICAKVACASHSVWQNCGSRHKMEFSGPPKTRRKTSEVISLILTHDYIVIF